jgi:hypothetical protein
MALLTSRVLAQLGGFVCSVLNLMSLYAPYPIGHIVPRSGSAEAAISHVNQTGHISFAAAIGRALGVKL